MEKKISRVRILEILNGVSELESLNGLELVSKVISNITSLEREKEQITRVSKLLEYSKEYQDEYRQIISEEIEYDDNGLPVMLNSNEYALKKDNHYKERVKEIEEKYKEEIDKKTKLRNDYFAFMEEEITLNLITIPKELLPKDITLKQYKLLTDMLETQLL